MAAAGPTGRGGPSRDYAPRNTATRDDARDNAGRDYAVGDDARRGPPNIIERPTASALLAGPGPCPARRQRRRAILASLQSGDRPRRPFSSDRDQDRAPRGNSEGGRYSRPSTGDRPRRPFSSDRDGDRAPRDGSDGGRYQAPSADGGPRRNARPSAGDGARRPGRPLASDATRPSGRSSGSDGERRPYRPSSDDSGRRVTVLRQVTGASALSAFVGRFRSPALRPSSGDGERRPYRPSSAGDGQRPAAPRSPRAGHRVAGQAAGPSVVTVRAARTSGTQTGVLASSETHARVPRTAVTHAGPPAAAAGPGMTVRGVPPGPIARGGQAGGRSVRPRATPARLGGSGALIEPPDPAIRRGQYCAAKPGERSPYPGHHHRPATRR